MRIDLPQCNFKNCRYSFDGNCTNKNKYESCEYQLDQAEIEELTFSNNALKGIKTFLTSEREEEIRAEAIKEFVKRLKEHSCFYDLDNYHSFRAVDVDDIDDIAKEMLGD